jgi:hypothetical protein
MVYQGMMYRFAADFLVIVHLAFILFVVSGGFLALKWRWLLWLHIPAAVWGVFIEFSSWVCPLTPLENALRMAGGRYGYHSGFIAEYVLPLIYPEALTQNLQVTLGVAVIFINVVAYGWLLLRRFRAET